MTTTKPKIQGYIDQKLADQFEAERQAWGLTQSQALERILAERYGMRQSREGITSNPPSDLLSNLEGITSDIYAKLDYGLLAIRDSINSRLNAIVENKLAGMLDNRLAELNNEANDRLDAKLASLERSQDSLNKLCFYCFGLAFTRIGRLEQIASPPAKEVPESSPGGISQRALGRRLGVSKATVGKRRDNPEELAAYTKERDPDGIAWRFEGGKYYPVQACPSNL
jgi:hypothetical protein